MERREKIRVVLAIVEQFNREIAEATVKRLFDDEYDPITISEEELLEIVVDLHSEGRLTTNKFGYLEIVSGVHHI